MKKIFVIEGTDGSGKQTQTAILYERLTKEGNSVFKTSFPNYNSPSSGPVKEYLSGNISQNPNDISAKAASLFYAVDRYITYKKNIESKYLDDKTLILLDRYVSSNLLHQGSKIIANSNDYDKLDEFANWIYEREFDDLELPRPSAVFFLYVPTEYTLKMMENRKNKITDENKKDIHESNPEHLLNSVKSGLYLAKKLNWHIIECVKDDSLRSIDEIHNEIYDIISNKYL